MCRSVSVKCYLPANKRMPYTSATAAPYKESPPPIQTKNFPRDPATHKKRNKIPSSEWRGHGGSSRRVWEVWRERESSFKRTPSPSKVFPSSPRSSSLHSPLQPKGSEGGVTENGFQSGQQVAGYGERAPKQNAAGEIAAAVKRQIRAVGIYLP